MSTPFGNPLDEFVSYTYHFQMIVANSTTIIDKATFIKTEYTLPWTPTKLKDGLFLLVNSYTDAAQVIDDLSFDTYFTTNADEPLAPNGELRFRVTEQGGTYFMEKLQIAFSEIGLSSFKDAVFALKIDFVGRLPDNTVKTVDGPIIRFFLVGFEANFDVKGAEYLCQAVPTGFGSNLGDRTAATIRKNMTAKGKTIGECFADLEKKINYEITVETDKQFAKNYGRKVRYVFDPGPYKDLDVNSLVKEETLNQANETMKSNVGNNGKDVYISFSPNLSITTCLSTILKSSPKLNDLITKKNADFKNKNFTALCAYKIIVSYESTPTEIVYKYKVFEYNGKPETDWTFYYSFTEQNVDVIDFDMKLNVNSAYLLYENKNEEKFVNRTDAVQDPIESLENSPEIELPPDQDQMLKSNGIMSKDRKCLPIYLKNEVYGIQKMTDTEAKNAKTHLDIIALVSGIPGTGFNMRIRGNPDLMFGSIDPLHEKGTGFTSPLNVKVIVRNSNGQEFWYKGNYVVVAMNHSFSSGLFIQSLNGFAADKDQSLNMAKPREASTATTQTEKVVIEKNQIASPTPQNPLVSNLTNSDKASTVSTVNNSFMTSRSLG